MFTFLFTIYCILCSYIIINKVIANITTESSNLRRNLFKIKNKMFLNLGDQAITDMEDHTHILSTFSWKIMVEFLYFQNPNFKLF